ncbi:hypothetical protein THF1D04_60255 [Vibrio owensii]|uniref:Uncharacterized protein n=1 Tax=Vibrio owensii TaxID=696485 RepID=A0AAU9QDG6_9VIBR|nr:hypothetical protein THF1D04_60255 [Vibrio owensii]
MTAPHLAGLFYIRPKLTLTDLDSKTTTQALIYTYSVTLHVPLSSSFISSCRVGSKLSKKPF